MPSQSIASKILTRMQASRGSVWSAKDLVDLGTRAAVDQALRRLSSDGSIRKVARGLYDYPQSGSLTGKRAPRPEAVMRAAARVRGLRVRPSGAIAANALGFSTQVPALAEYITDGLAQNIDVGGQTIRLKRVAPKRVSVPSGAGALIEALRYIGQAAADRLTDAQIDRAARALDAADLRALRNAVLHAPAWMLATIRRVVAVHDAGDNDA
jgi:Family of unknown function (DUF6088)